LLPAIGSCNAISLKNKWGGLNEGSGSSVKGAAERKIDYSGLEMFIIPGTGQLKEKSRRRLVCKRTVV